MAIFYKKLQKLLSDWRQIFGCDAITLHQFAQCDKINIFWAGILLFSLSFFLYQVIAMYSNHKIWCILGLGLSLLFIYIIYNFSKRTFSALPLVSVLGLLSFFVA